MESLAHLVVRRRRLVFIAWIALTIFGMYGAGQVSDRWFQQFSIPGYSAYEANQRALEATGTGERTPLVAVFRARSGDVTKIAGIEQAIERAAAVNRGARVSSYFDGRNSLYVSKDRRTTFAEIYPAGQQQFEVSPSIKRTRAALKSSAPSGVTAYLTGIDPLFDAQGENGGSGIWLEVALGGIGALVVLMFVFGTLPAVAIPLAIAASSILTTFSLIWLLTYVTDVSIIVQFLVAMIGLGVAIDYSLLMIFRFREELRRGQDVESALVQTMTHAGRSVVVSGSTVAIGLLSLIILPLPFIRSIGIGGMLIPAVSVIASITLLPALLSLLGHRINSVRIMPKRFSHAGDPESGAWGRWAQRILRRPVAAALAGAVVVALLLIPASQLNPAETQAKDFPGGGDALTGRDVLAASGITAGVIKPFTVVIEGAKDPGVRAAVAQKVAAVDGVAGATAPSGPGWSRGGVALVEAFPAGDASAKSARQTMERIRDDALPAVAAQSGGARITLAGTAPEERDFVHAVYGKFPLVLLFVIVLTYVLLARAFRSLLLPLKAVILNLVSLGAAYGIVVFIFQQGHGSDAIWNVEATQAIVSWIPLMIFAFLFGLSMDYEVFMLTRIREAYDDTGDTNAAVAEGLAHTGKLVTSAALILMFAFFALSTGPGVDIKQFGIGLAAGIILDATLIRAVLVPSIMRLMGDWNWWFPPSVARLLRVDPPAPVGESAA